MAGKVKKGLTAKQRLFCATYLADPELNATRAYMTVYKVSEKVAGANAARLLGNDRIQAHLAQALNSIEKREEKALMEAFEVESRLDALIRFNLKDFVNSDGKPREIHELTDEQAGCVRELGVIETQIGTHRSLKFYDKLTAIKTKMERLGLLKAKIDFNLTVETYEQKIKRLRGEE